MISIQKMRWMLLLLVGVVQYGAAQVEQGSPTPSPTRQESLGYPATARLLIIHADDFGMNHSVNQATIAALEKGWITSASILVPCPWFPEVVNWTKSHPDADIGIHLALDSEWTTFRWGPVSSRDKVPSLLDPDGYLPLDTPEVAHNAKSSEAEAELRAQIDRAQKSGIHLTHLDSHMEALFESPELYKVYQEIGRAYGLPVLEARSGTQRRTDPAPPDEDVLIDKVIQMDPGIDPQKWMSWYQDQLTALPPGVYEVIVHLAYDDDEMRGASLDHPDWGAAWRQRDLGMVRSEEFRSFLREQKFVLIGWKDLQKALPKDYGTRQHSN